MKEFRIYFGKKFYKQKCGYWTNRKLKEPIILAHRWVWINHHGTIPKGMDIHHKDGDKSNNEIKNLEMLNRSDHLKRHWEEGSFDLENRQKQLDNVRPIEYLKSEEGRKAVSEKGKQVWRDRGYHTIKCENCGQKADFRRWARFCSKKCYMQWRWVNVLKDKT